MREAVGVLFVQADQLKELVYALLTALCVVHAVDDHTLFNDGGNGHTRIQRSVRILENDLRFFRILETRCGVFQIQLFAGIVELAGRCGINAHGHTAERGLAAAGLADKAERFALINIERNVVDGLQHTAGNLKVLAYVVQNDQFFITAHPAHPFLLRSGNRDGAASRLPHDPRPP